MYSHRLVRIISDIARHVCLVGVLAFVLTVTLAACGGGTSVPVPTAAPTAPAGPGGVVARIATVVAPGGLPGAGAAKAGGTDNGPGSSVHPSKGTCPADHPVKGRVMKGQRVYSSPGSSGYDQTKAETCFATAEEAEAAGYHAGG